MYVRIWQTLSWRSMSFFYGYRWFVVVLLQHSGSKVIKQNPRQAMCPDHYCVSESALQLHKNKNFSAGPG
jgi:hypothetical protein